MTQPLHYVAGSMAEYEDTFERSKNVPRSPPIGSGGTGKNMAFPSGSARAPNRCTTKPKVVSTSRACPRVWAARWGRHLR
jgi:hypothetical protein